MTGWFATTQIKMNIGYVVGALAVFLFTHDTARLWETTGSWLIGQSIAILMLQIPFVDDALHRVVHAAFERWHQ